MKKTKNQIIKVNLNKMLIFKEATNNQQMIITN